MARSLILLVSYLFLLVACEMRLGGFGTPLSLENGQQQNPSLPVDPPGEEPPITDLPIEDLYPFLQEEAFWARVAEITPIPVGKSCRNRASYAYMGIARLVSQYYFAENFPMFPFGEVTYRYHRFPDGIAPQAPKDYELFGQSALFANLVEIEDFIREDSGRSLTVTGITKHHDFDHDLHCRHRGGNVFDMRPLPATRPMTWRDRIYDRRANLNLIRAFIADPRVQVVFFNDPEILNDEEIRRTREQRESAGVPVVFQAVSGHDNHIHVEFVLPEEVRRITDFVFQSRISGWSVRPDPYEYEQH